MEASQQVELQAANFLQKCIQDSKDEPTILVKKLYVMCQHMKMAGKENSLPYQVISRAMENIISQHGIDVNALNLIHNPLIGGTQMIGNVDNQFNVGPSEVHRRNTRRGIASIQSQQLDDQSTESNTRRGKRVSSIPCGEQLFTSKQEVSPNFPPVAANSKLPEDEYFGGLLQPDSINLESEFDQTLLNEHTPSTEQTPPISTQRRTCSTSASMPRNVRRRCDSTDGRLIEPIELITESLKKKSLSDSESLNLTNTTNNVYNASVFVDIVARLKTMSGFDIGKALSIIMQPGKADLFQELDDNIARRWLVAEIALEQHIREHQKYQMSGSNK